MYFDLTQPHRSHISPFMTQGTSHRKDHHRRKVSQKKKTACERLEVAPPKPYGQMTKGERKRWRKEKRKIERYAAANPFTCRAAEERSYRLPDRTDDHPAQISPAIRLIIRSQSIEHQAFFQKARGGWKCYRADDTISWFVGSEMMPIRIWLEQNGYEWEWREFHSQNLIPDGSYPFVCKGIVQGAVAPAHNA